MAQLTSEVKLLVNFGKVNYTLYKQHRLLRKNLTFQKKI